MYTRRISVTRPLDLIVYEQLNKQVKLDMRPDMQQSVARSEENSSDSSDDESDVGHDDEAVDRMVARQLQPSHAAPPLAADAHEGHPADTTEIDADASAHPAKRTKTGSHTHGNISGKPLPVCCIICLALLGRKRSGKHVQFPGFLCELQRCEDNTAISVKQARLNLMAAFAQDLINAGKHDDCVIEYTNGAPSSVQWPIGHDVHAAITTHIESCGDQSPLGNRLLVERAKSALATQVSSNQRPETLLAIMKHLKPK